MSSLDYIDLCRLCLVKDRVSVPIFEGEGDARQIYFKIAACLPVKVTREDKLPKKICNDCVYKLELFYQFWTSTAAAEKQLQQWLGIEVNMEDKQGYVSTVLNPSGMKPEQSNENRLDGTVLQQVSEHQNNMNIAMMDNMSMGMPMMMASNTPQQITSVPMDNSGSSVQNVQPVAGPSTQTTHDQITQNQTDAPTQQEDEEESSEEDDNSDDECEGDEGLPIKEEGEEDPNNSRTIEPTTFVNVSLACDEAGPSGLQQQKIADIPEMVMPPAADVDPKTGVADPLRVEFNIVQKSFPRNECEWKRRKLSMEYEEQIAGQIDTDLTIREPNLRLVTEENRATKRKAMCVECDHCRRKFPKKSNLVEHLRQHRHKCTDCPKTFSLRRYLIAHVEKNHRQQVYECSVCKYKSNNKGTLKNHYIRLHTSNYDYACDTCGKQFKIKKALNHHVKQNHSGAPPIVCDVCGHFSKNLHALKAHMKYRHYKPEFVCRICRRGMTTQENLEQHLTWHETREKVLCPTCGKRFRGRDLDSHMRVHTGVKPFPCPVCGKTFRRQTAQEQHVLIHTGKRPYICDICGQAFAQKPGLICHRKRHPGPLPPLPVVSIKNIVTEFTREYATKNALVKIE